MSHDRCAVFTTAMLGGLAGHQVGDYLEQPDWAARAKQQPGRGGWQALARHVAGYVASQATARAVCYRAAGLRVPAPAQLAGAVVEGVLHGLVDDGRLLRRYARVTGKAGFHDLTSGGLCGKALLDQAAHLGVQVPLGAVVTSVVAARMGRAAA